MRWNICGCIHGLFPDWREHFKEIFVPFNQKNYLLQCTHRYLKKPMRVIQEILLHCTKVHDFTGMLGLLDVTKVNKKKLSSSMNGAISGSVHWY